VTVMEPLSAADGDPFVGRTVADRFEVVSKIGSGGMGTVYEAVQHPLNRPVALKLLKEEVSWDPDTITRFHREAKAMSLLAHPNTVRVFDFGQTPSGTLYLAMERLTGQLLTTKLEQLGALEPEDAIRVVQQILASLHEAHAKGIVHRDLKPDNIYLAQVDGHAEPVVKVLDFGIAKVFHGENEFDQLETQAGTVFGTPRYMSPEQAQGRTLDARSDLYSVGVLLYQLVTGSAPFRDEDAVVVMAKHIRDAPTPPEELAPTRPIGPRLSRAILKALEKDPARRFQSAQAFIVGLEKAAEEARTYRASGTGVFPTARDRKRLYLAAAGVLVAATILGGIIVASVSAPSDEPVEVASAPPEDETVIPDDLEVEMLADPPRAQTIVSNPPGAIVYHDDVIVCQTPCDVEIAEEIDYELRLEGYEARHVTVLPRRRNEFVLRREGIVRDTTPDDGTQTEIAARPRMRARPVTMETAAPMEAAPAMTAPAAMTQMMNARIAGQDGYGERW